MLDDIKLQKIISEKVILLSQRLQAKGWTLTVAESCTGGAIATHCTNLAGSSAWFTGGFVTYSNQLKGKILSVSAQTLNYYGAVSEPVVAAMSEGALIAAEVDIAVAVSGIAGPDGGTADKPVGTVCFAVASKDAESVTRTYLLTGDRYSIRQQSVDCALQLLLNKLN